MRPKAKCSVAGNVNSGCSHISAIPIANSTLNAIPASCSTKLQVSKKIVRRVDPHSSVLGTAYLKTLLRLCGLRDTSPSSTRWVPNVDNVPRSTASAAMPANAPNRSGPSMRATISSEPACVIRRRPRTKLVRMVPRAMGPLAWTVANAVRNAVMARDLIRRDAFRLIAGSGACAIRPNYY